MTHWIFINAINKLLSFLICNHLQCISCKNKTDTLYQGKKFLCHSKFPKQQKDHNKLCKACAKDWENVTSCPYHGEAYKYDPAALKPGKRDKTPPPA